MNSTQANPALSQLRDIHLPTRIGWWPPAPGWWVLLALLLVLLAGGLIWRYARKRNAWRRFARAELARLRTSNEPPQATVSALSVLLRRVAISRFPREQVAALNGETWLAFLDSSIDKPIGFQSVTGRLLTSAPYRADTAIEPTALHALFDLCERWLKQLPGRQP
jgi:hypothetical protein